MAASVWHASVVVQKFASLGIFSIASIAHAKNFRVNPSLILFAQITKFAAVGGSPANGREIAAVVVVCQ